MYLKPNLVSGFIIKKLPLTWSKYKLTQKVYILIVRDVEEPDFQIK